MKILCVYLLGCVNLISCNSTQTASQYFQRQQINQCITAFEVGYMFCNGIKKEIPPKMIIPESVDDSDYMIDYYTDKEYRLYICLRFGECS